MHTFGHIIARVPLKAFFGSGPSLATPPINFVKQQIDVNFKISYVYI